MRLRNKRSRKNCQKSTTLKTLTTSWETLNALNVVKLPYKGALGANKNGIAVDLVR